MYNRAVLLIKKGKAYVCDLTSEEMREYRGTLTEPGKESPYRNRSVEENLELFEKMKNGEFKDGEKFELKEGDFLPFDARIEHNVISKGTSKVLVTISQSLS